MTLPDCYIDQDSYDKMIAKARLDAPSIVAKVLATLGETQGAARVQIA